MGVANIRLSIITSAVRADINYRTVDHLRIPRGALQLAAFIYSYTEASSKAVHVTALGNLFKSLLNLLKLYDYIYCLCQFTSTGILTYLPLYVKLYLRYLTFDSRISVLSKYRQYNIIFNYILIILL